MRESDLLKLEAICRAAGVTLLVVRSYGLVGTMRASAPQHCVTDSKPDSQVRRTQGTLCNSNTIPSDATCTCAVRMYTCVYMYCSVGWRINDGFGA